MEHIKNFKKYIPESEDKKQLIESFNVFFLISEDGKDWYESQSIFKEDTVKLMYDEKGIIRAITKNVSSLYPEAKSVVELDAVPEDVTIDGSWKIENGVISKREASVTEKVAAAEIKKQSLFDSAEKKMAPLRDAVSLDIATDEEKGIYKEWQKYRVLLNRLDTSEPDNISWPAIPDK